MKHNPAITLGLATAVMLFAPHAGAQSTQKRADELETGSTKLGSITGRVLADGQPVNNASITVPRLNANVPPRAAPTSDAGDFEVKGLEPGVYRIWATAPGYVSRSTDSDEETYYRVGESVRLTMIRGGVITGKVLNAGDEPVVAVRVRATMIRDVNGKPPTDGGPSIDQFTDDRGIYRIFGLLPGTYLVFAGGRGSSDYGPNAYDKDAPTYAPSSTRDTAAEILVSSGEEKAVDIRYRGDAGHALSGTVIAPVIQNSPVITIALARLTANAPETRMSIYLSPDSKAFEFYGVADGEYLIWAARVLSDGTLVSEPRRVTVKSADVTGIELTVKPLAGVAGEFVLEHSSAESCKGKRRPLFEETLVAIQRNQKQIPKDQPQIPLYGAGQAAADGAGKFSLRNLGPGQYGFDVRFFARYWYLRSITQRAVTEMSKATPTNPTTDVARTWFTLKSGDRVTGLKVTLAEGAASLAGRVAAPKDQKPGGQLFIYLVPAEKEKSDDVFRYSVAEVEPDGSFSLNNLPPGRYWSLVKLPRDYDLMSTPKLRLPGSAARMKLRREAADADLHIELEPCQNVSDYKLPGLSDLAP
ncbi:MAG: carboxypeptidase-like regulatory domain-containing protein [Pyrinomonadaceae bacterium]